MTNYFKYKQQNKLIIKIQKAINSNINQKKKKKLQE